MAYTTYTNPYDKPKNFTYADDGSGKNLAAVDQTLGGLAKYDPGAAPGAYQDTSGYGGLIADKVNKILDNPGFSYTPSSDPLYQMYADQYRRDGQRAMEDTAGQAAALSGGYGNSYAASAGANAYNQSLQQMGAVLPQLQQAAYQRYQDAAAGDRSDLAALQGLSDDAYSRYRDTVGDWQNARDFGLQNWNAYAGNLIDQAGLYAGQQQTAWNQQFQPWQAENANYQTGADLADSSARYDYDTANTKTQADNAATLNVLLKEYDTAVQGGDKKAAAAALDKIRVIYQGA